MTELVVLTCASGKQCTQLIPLLYESASLFRLRLVVHSEHSRQRLERQWKNAEVLRVDFANPDQCASALRGASTLYYVGPTFIPDETQYGFNMITAAIAESKKPDTKFSHFVFSSVMHPCISKMLNHDRKRLIEERLIESGLPYTILQPSHFADNAIERLLTQRDEQHPIFSAAHNPSIAFSFTCLRDYAEVSAKIIAEREKHSYATYQLLSTHPMRYTEYVESIASVVGKPFEIRRMAYDEAVRRYCKLIFGEEMEELDQVKRDGPERMLLYYNGRGLVGNPGILEWLLGRPGTTPAQLAKLKLAEMRMSQA